jgi:hypothetical protein
MTDAAMMRPVVGRMVRTVRRGIMRRGRARAGACKQVGRSNTETWENVVEKAVCGHGSYAAVEKLSLGVLTFGQWRRHDAGLRATRLRRTIFDRPAVKLWCRES